MRLDKYVSFLLMLVLPFVTAGQVPRAADFDVLIQNGMVYVGHFLRYVRIPVIVSSDSVRNVSTDSGAS